MPTPAPSMTGASAIPFPVLPDSSLPSPSKAKVRSRASSLGVLKRVRTAIFSLRNRLPFSFFSPSRSTSASASASSSSVSASASRSKTFVPAPGSQFYHIWRWWRRRRASSPCLSPLLFLFLLLSTTLLILLLARFGFGFRGPTWQTLSVTGLHGYRAGSGKDELAAPLNHFRPPSLFAAEVCVRRFDQAWRMLSHRTSPRPVVSALKRSSADGGADSAHPIARLAYAIQASGNTVELLPRLLSRIHHARNVYVLHIDAKVELQRRQRISELIANSSEYARNVFVLPSEMLTYRGISSVVNSLALMTLALEKDAEWDYYINLSASDYPLVSTEALGRLLARPRVPVGLLNYVWFFPRKEWVPYLFRFRHMFWDPAASGLQSTKTQLHYLDGSKGLPWQQSRAFVFTKAEAWAILSRPVVQFLIRSSFAKRMLLAHAHVLSVSEHFVTDTLFNHGVWRDTLVPDSFRKVIWYHRGRRSGQHPYEVDRGPSLFTFWNEIEGTTSIFVRKITKPDSKLLDRIDAEISGVGLGDLDERFAQFAQKRKLFLQRLVERFDNITQLTLRQQRFTWRKDAYPPL